MKTYINKIIQMQQKTKSQYRNLFKLFKQYFNLYGGWSSLFSSPSFHFAFILTFFLFHFWLYKKWWEIPINVLPNLMGFSITGYAILLAFGDKFFQYKLAIIENNNKRTPYLKISSVFAHFVIVQAIALTLAIIAKALDFTPSINPKSINIIQKLVPVGNAIGFFFFLYAIFTAFPSILRLFKISTDFSTYINNHRREDKDNNFGDSDNLREHS